MTNLDLVLGALRMFGDALGESKRDKALSGQEKADAEKDSAQVEALLKKLEAATTWEFDPKSGDLEFDDEWQMCLDDDEEFRLMRALLEG